MKMNVIFVGHVILLFRTVEKVFFLFTLSLSGLQKYKRSKTFFVCLLIFVQSAIVNSFRGSARGGSKSSKMLRMTDFAK